MKFKFKPTLRCYIPRPPEVESVEMPEIIAQIDNMSETERELQCALGLLCDWIIIVEDIAILRQRSARPYPRSTHIFQQNLSYQIYVVVKAINRAHANRQIKQSRYFPKADFRVCRGWQSDIMGEYYRKIFRNQCELKGYREERIFILP
ncbi:hypothetical protein LCGC14_3129640 [marine sediment metagenome]|uniref:Uncharacterized protein n=1 Tax=marine sediment metagenome TaxID=412755 RepID=A0A0F8WNX0_9ZZZZ